MSEQLLPNYHRKFLTDKRWLTKESAHYIFHYFAQSVAEQLQAMVEAGVITQDQANRRLDIDNDRSLGGFGRNGVGNLGKRFGGR